MTHLIRGTVNWLNDHLWDFKLGIRTGGVHPSGAPSRFKECWPTEYRVLNKVFHDLDIQDNDILVDYGCGQGRVICFASQFPCKRIYGIEISQAWAEMAQANVRKMRLSNVEVLNMNAIDFACSDCTVFYLFNPFGEETLSHIIQNILETLKNNDRHIKIVYYNAQCNHVLEREKWIKMTRSLYVDRKGNPAVLLYENI